MWDKGGNPEQPWQGLPILEHWSLPAVGTEVMESQVYLAVMEGVVVAALVVRVPAIQMALELVTVAATR